MAHVLGGMFVGLVAGGVAAAFVWMLSEATSLWVPGGVLLTAMTAGGVLGGVLGEPFFDWIGTLPGRLDVGAPDGMSSSDWYFDD